MALNPEQWQRIWLLSDTDLYSQAVEFVRVFVEEEKEKDQEKDGSLPSTQANGLLNVADNLDYIAIKDFIKNQQRPGSKPRIQTFYGKLEKKFADLYKKLGTTLDLVPEPASSQEKNEVMLVVAREFIQHLVAENGLYVKAAEEERARRKQQTGKGNNDARS